MLTHTWLSVQHGQMSDRAGTGPGSSERLLCLDIIGLDITGTS